MERALLEHELKEWDESLHPRGEGGRFVSGDGGAVGVSAPVTRSPTWQSPRAGLDTAHLTGKRARAVDPPHLPAALAEKRMLDLYDRAIEQGHVEDANWYVDKHNQIGQWADDLGVDRQRFTDAVAATSPLTAWNLPNSPRLPNLEAARAMVQAERAHPEMTPEQLREITPHSKPYPFIGQNAENAVRALRGENPDDVFSANKIRSFNNNLSHPDSNFDVTVDTHMGRAMLNLHEDTKENLKAVKDLIEGRKIGRGESATTVGGYGWAADRIRGAAEQRRMNPAAFQAVVWEQWRREGGALTNRSPEAIRARMAKVASEIPDDLTEEEVWALWQDIIDWANAGAPKDWPESKTVEEKFNPYHDERGRFAAEEGATFVSSWGKPEEGGVVGPRAGKEMPEDYSRERMTAKREAMISEAAHRTEALDRRARENQATYDREGDIYMRQAQIQRDAYEASHQAFERVDAAYSQVEAGSMTRDQIQQLELAYGRAQAQVERANADMKTEVVKFNTADQAFRKEYDAINAERAALGAEMRAKYVNAPSGPGEIGLDAKESQFVQRPDGTWVQDVAKSMTGEPPAAWRDGMKAVNEMIGNAVPAGSPTATVRTMDEHDPWYNSARSYHNDFFGVTMHPEASTSTMVHEMGHWVESHVPGATAAIWDHIDSRTQGETNRSLQLLTGNPGYNSDEVAKPDKFADPYMGKEYNRRASEFLSMSLQHMYEDPVGFAKKDPQSFDFTNQLLAQARAFGNVPSPKMLGVIESGR